MKRLSHIPRRVLGLVLSLLLVVGLVFAAQTPVIAGSLSGNNADEDVTLNTEDTAWIAEFDFQGFDASNPQLELAVNGVDVTAQLITNEEGRKIYEAPAGTSATNVQFTVRYRGINTEPGHVFKVNHESFNADWTSDPKDVTDECTKNMNADSISFQYTAPNLVNGSDVNLNMFSIYYVWENEGDPAIVDEASRYIYAYSGNAQYSLDSFARELYARFIQVPMFESFDLPVGDIEADNSGETLNRFNVGVHRLYLRCVPRSQFNSITAKKSDGTEVQIDYDTVDVTWGHRADNGQEIKSTLRVYNGLQPNDVLICTDFDEKTGTGTKFFIRNMETDRVPFTLTGEDAVAVVDDYKTVKVGGNGCMSDVVETDGQYTLNIWSRVSNSPENMDMNAYRGMIRVLNNSNTYVAVVGSGETKAVGNLKSDGAPVDQIFETGDGKEALTYIGDSTVTIKPLTSALVGAAKSKLSDVTLKDATLSDGIKIDKSDLNNVKITFASNFYDNAPLTITYSDGTKRDLTIKRVGLVIGTMYSMDDGRGTKVGEMPIDCNGSFFNYTYDYYAGEQILIYAIYYHPSNDKTVSGSNNLSLNVHYDDGRNVIIPHADKGYAPAANGGVATTVFVLGYAHAKQNQDDNGIWTGNITSQNVGGLSATVINAGYDDEDSYGGTQIGSGDGVYWDGQIDWFE